MIAFYSDTFALPPPGTDNFRFRKEASGLVVAACPDRDLPAAVAMSGGYAPGVEAIATIHLNTIKEAVLACRSVSAS